MVYGDFYQTDSRKRICVAVWGEFSPQVKHPSIRETCEVQLTEVFVLPFLRSRVVSGPL